MFVFVFVYIKKYKLQTEKSELNYRDYCSHFVILMVLKVYISLVTQKLMINCIPHNQSNRWNFCAVIIKAKNQLVSNNNALKFLKNVLSTEIFFWNEKFLNAKLISNLRYG